MYENYIQKLQKTLKKTNTYGLEKIMTNKYKKYF